MVCEGISGGGGSNDYNVHSIEFYRIMAQAKADLNRDGKIDDAEKSIFDKEIKKFDVDGNEGLSDSDVNIYKSSVIFSDKELAEKEQRLNNFDGAILQKRCKILGFRQWAEEALQYLLDLAKNAPDETKFREKLDSFDGYFESYKNTYTDGQG